jgi:elongation factor G
MLMMHSNNREEIKEAYRGRHRRARRPEGHHHGRHAVRSAEAGRPGAHGVPRAGHRDRGGAEDEGRPGEDVGRVCSVWRRGPVLPRGETDEESGQTIIKGMGELHLDILVDRMKREFKVEANIGAPQVAYRETIGHAASIDYTHKKQSGGRASSPASSWCSSRRSRARLRVRKQDRRRLVPKEYIPGVEKGLKSAKDNGRDRRLPGDRLQGGPDRRRLHDVDSSVLAFEIAARGGVPRRLAKGRPVLLEPIMKVEVVTPEEYMGDIIGDLNSAAARSRAWTAAATPRWRSTPSCRWPTCSATSTRCAMSQGRAQFTMQFDHYDEVPQNMPTR